MTCCRICGAPAPYFTDAYDPAGGERITVPLCREHQQELADAIRAYIGVKIMTMRPGIQGADL